MVVKAAIIDESGMKRAGFETMQALVQQGDAGTGSVLRNISGVKEVVYSFISGYQGT